MIDRPKQQHRQQQREQLLHRLRRRFELTERNVTVGSLTIPFTLIKNPDTVLDQIVAEADRREKISGLKQNDDELHLPYWAELWDSAIGIAEHLVAQGDKATRGQGDKAKESDPRLVAVSPCRRVNLDPRLVALSPCRLVNVLDLGCGMGFAGTVAAALGFDVLLADIEPEALLLAQLNALQFSSRVRARRLDWRRDRLDESFDLILGADLLYDKSQWKFLDAFWTAHLAKNGSILLGEPGRQTGEMFRDQLSLQSQWKFEQFSQPVSTRKTPIRLFRLFR